MAANRGRTEIKTSVDTSDVERAARELPAALDREVGAALSDLGDRFVAETRRKLRSGPGGRSGTNSRDQAARGVQATVRDGRLALTSDPSMPARHRGFPAFYGLGRWTHPVFGGRARVTQRGAEFWQPRTYENEAARLLEKAGQDAADKIG